MTIPRVTDIHNYHEPKCNEKTCIGYRLEPNKKKYISNFPTRHEYIKESYFMTATQYRKALKELVKFAKLLNPRLREIKKRDGRVYLTLVKNDPFYWKSSIQVYSYGRGNYISDIALQFTDRRGKIHSKRILVSGLHRFEYAIKIIVRHYSKIYSN